MNVNEIHEALEKLGFIENSYVETILVTRNRDGSFNSAPIGVIRQGNTMEVRPFKSSMTYRNLIKTTRVSINITDKPMLFLETAFKDEISRLPVVNDWVLEGSDATFLADKIGESNFSDIQASFTLEPVNLSITRKMPTVFSRGRAEAIEAIIHASRIKVFHRESNESKVQELVEKMKETFNIITRVSDSSSAEVKVVEELKSLLEKWGVLL